MISLLDSILSGLIGILPMSPFQSTLWEEITNFEFLPYLNWFVPFDICLHITKLWVPCIGAYYAYSVTKKVVFDYIINKLFS